MTDVCNRQRAANEPLDGTCPECGSLLGLHEPAPFDPLAYERSPNVPPRSIPPYCIATGGLPGFGLRMPDDGIPDEPIPLGTPEGSMTDEQRDPVAEVIAHLPDERYHSPDCTDGVTSHTRGSRRVRRAAR